MASVNRNLPYLGEPTFPFQRRSDFEWENGIEYLVGRKCSRCRSISFTRLPDPWASGPGPSIFEFHHVSDEAFGAYQWGSVYRTANVSNEGGKLEFVRHPESPWVEFHLVEPERN